MKRKISILSLSLMFSFTFLSGNVFAYKESDLRKFKKSFSSMDCFDVGCCRNCDLQGLKFWEFGKNLRGVDLSGSNLKSIHFQKNADLTFANLSGTNLTRAKLRSMNLTEANLNGANLSGADLRGANLTGANLTGANLRGANLKKTKLTNANLSGANLEDVKGLPNEIRIEWEKGSRARKKAEEKRIELAKKAAEKKRKDDKKAALVAKKKKEEESLSGLYMMYISLKTCYEVRKGQSFIYIKKSQMDEIKSYTKKMETKMFEESSRLKSLKDKIWEDTSKKTTKQIRYLKSTEYSNGKEMCDGILIPFMMMAEQMFPPTGEVIEKDF